MRLVSIAYAVDDSAGSITIGIERVGGDEGAASADYTTAAGTALAGTNYTTTAGTMSWADGVSGTKYVTIPILAAAGDDEGKTFTFTLSNEVGAVIQDGTPGPARHIATVTILDSNANSTLGVLNPGAL